MSIRYGAYVVLSGEVLACGDLDIMMAADRRGDSFRRPRRSTRRCPDGLMYGLVTVKLAFEHATGLQPACRRLTRAALSDAYQRGRGRAVAAATPATMVTVVMQR